MSAADEVARLEAETATAVSASVVAQAAAADAVRDAENLKHEVTRDAAETIRERDEEIAVLKGETEWLKNELKATTTALESLELSVMGLVMLANPPETSKASAPLTPAPEVPSVGVVDPEAAVTKPLPAATPPEEPESPKKRHKLL